MWVRKSACHISRIRDRILLSLRGPFTWLIIVVVMFIASVFSPRNAEGHWPRSWTSYLLYSTLIGMGIAIVVWTLQLILNRNISPFNIGNKVVICRTCHRTKNRDGNNECECGGMFEPFENWTWIDDNKDDCKYQS